MSDYAAARHNMVESQIRPNQVTDATLLRALNSVPRESFVPASLQAMAYMEDEIQVTPARQGMPARCLVSPMPLARLVQLAEVEADNLVLDVGCATGYSTALLAGLAESVVGLESEEALAGSGKPDRPYRHIDAACRCFHHQFLCHRWLHGHVSGDAVRPRPKLPELATGGGSSQ